MDSAHALVSRIIEINLHAARNAEERRLLAIKLVREVLASAEPVLGRDELALLLKREARALGRLNATEDPSG